MEPSSLCANQPNRLFTEFTENKLVSLISEITEDLFKCHIYTLGKSLNLVEFGIFR